MGREQSGIPGFLGWGQRSLAWLQREFSRLRNKVQSTARGGCGNPTAQTHTEDGVALPGPRWCDTVAHTHTEVALPGCPGDSPVTPAPWEGDRSPSPPVPRSGSTSPVLSPLWRPGVTLPRGWAEAGDVMELLWIHPQGWGGDSHGAVLSIRGWSVGTGKDAPGVVSFPQTIGCSTLPGVLQRC